MKAIVFEEYGDPEVLHLTDVEEPHAGPGQVRLRIVAAAVNPLDHKIRRGLLPHICLLYT
ncbi:NADP-dependent oxidoreductase, partial [Streptomyces sp. GC420]|nr:NADP-dependent oxidoreductase [Streptomyces sp. GC420]